MRCYECGAELNSSDICPKCGADVSYYKKAKLASIQFYNLGLARAEKRELTSAIESLKLAVILDRDNIDAHNLLGLVYHEVGDIVSALSEWVISNNIVKDKNIAGKYIKEVQDNPGRFEEIANSVKNYNISLKYAKEKNFDLANIQLKKVIDKNPKLLRAYELLALIYMRNKEYVRAKKLLIAVQKIDRSNPLAQKYLNEIDFRTQKKKKKEVREEEKMAVLDNKPLSGNDVIIPKSTYREPSNGAITIINVLVGVLIGAALVWFLIIPAKNRGNSEEYNSSIQQYSEKLASSNSELENLEGELKEVKADRDSLNEKIKQLSSDSGSNKLLISLIKSADLFIANDPNAAAEALIDIDVSQLPGDDAKKLYNTISGAVSLNAANSFYDQGMAAFYTGDFAMAIENLNKAYKLDKTKVDAVYNIAKSYVALQDTDNAKKFYKIITDEFKESAYVAEAQNFLDSHN